MFLYNRRPPLVSAIAPTNKATLLYFNHNLFVSLDGPLSPSYILLAKKFGAIAALLLRITAAPSCNTFFPRQGRSPLTRSLPSPPPTPFWVPTPRERPVPLVGTAPHPPCLIAVRRKVAGPPPFLFPLVFPQVF